MVVFNGPESISIPLSEYEDLKTDSRRLAAIADSVDEFYMKSKILRSDHTSKRLSQGDFHTHMTKLRRGTISQIRQLLQRKHI